MNLTAYTKLWKRLLLVGSVIGTAQLGSAMNYSNTDLLLIFRQDGFNDVEFDIGAVTNFIGLAQGAQKTVTYDTNLVSSNFNNNLAGVSFLLTAATGLGDPAPRVWVTDVYQSSVPTDVTYSQFSQLRSTISSVGLQGSILTASNSLPVVVPSSEPGSFSYVASGGNLTPASSLGGLTSFPVEAVGAGSLSFYEIHIATSTPRPPATLLGTFKMDGAGQLAFTAGNAVVLAQPTITSIMRSGATTTLSFTTVSGTKYQLQTASSLPGSFGPVGSPVTGDGTPKTFSDTSSDPVRFYRIGASN